MQSLLHTHLAPNVETQQHLRVARLVRLRHPSSADAYREHRLVRPASAPVAGRDDRPPRLAACSLQGGAHHHATRRQPHIELGLDPRSHLV